jgi:hypothetical protein
MSEDAVNNQEAIVRFAQLARAYCKWAESSPGEGKSEMWVARRHLAGLYAQALELPQLDCVDVESPSISHEEWSFVFRRFGVLPVSYYSDVMDAFNVESADTCVGDLGDDLADIWRDLKRGLVLFDKGHEHAAAWEWNEHFQIHWGQHAASAMDVIQCWIGARSRY